MRVLIGGGGPAGLTASYLLSGKGVKARLYERDGDVGGIAKTVKYKGCLFDLGGHRFFTKIKKVDEIWAGLMGEDLLTRHRLSRIYYKRRFFNYPLRPTNVILNVGLVESALVFLSYLKSQLIPQKSEVSFEDYVVNRFGRRLYETFFRTYTEKVWGMSCGEIRAEWASQRIKDMSFMSVLKNSLFRGSDSIKSLIDEFKYPKHGPGQMWERMSERIVAAGGGIYLNSEIVGVHIEKDRVESVSIKCNGKVREEGLDHFVSTLPLDDLMRMLTPTPPEQVIRAAEKLRYRDFLIVALMLDRRDTWPDTWIYIHDKRQKVGRIQNYNNWSPYMVSEKGMTCVGMEYFCFEGDELWSMPDAKLISLASGELTELSLIDGKSSVIDGTVVRVRKAYPVYDAHYRQNLEVVIKYLSQIKNLQTIGRNGTHRYNNMDHSMLTAMYAVENIGGAKHNIWEVNAEQDYHELEAK